MLCAPRDSEYQSGDRSASECAGRTIFNWPIDLRHVIGGIFYVADCRAYDGVISFYANKVTLLLIHIPYRAREITNRIDVIIEAGSASNKQDHRHNSHWPGPKKEFAASL
jgi:hypothetical protein